MNSFQSFEDITLLEFLREGNEKAFNEIYDRYWSKLFAVANNRLKNPMEAEEIVQDVFISIWKRREDLAITHTLSTYLSVAVKFQILNKQASKHYQMGKNCQEISDHQITANTTQLWIDAKELKEQLDATMDRLPEKCRLVFTRSRQNYKTNREIASELKISVKTVEAHITRALGVLRKVISMTIPLILHFFK